MHLQTDRLEELIEARRVADGLPGIAAGVVVDGELAWFHGSGRADLDRPEAPTVRTLSRVASITKTFTATAILQLRDEGRLSLDDPLELHLPEFGAVRERGGGLRSAVTFRRLLTHRSGLVTEPPLPSWDLPSFPTMVEILAALPETAVVIPPDSAWKYSNLAFGLLGEVVARLSGRSYADYLRDEITAPLGLDAVVLALDERTRPLAATGYLHGEFEDRPRVAPVAPLNGHDSAGQLYAGVSDLARWVSFQFREDGGPRGGSQILAGPTLAEMHRPHYLEPDWSGGHALAWRMHRVGDHVYHEHGGGIHGFASNVTFNLPARTGAIVLVNLWPAGAAYELGTALLESILSDPAAGGAAVSGDVRATDRFSTRAAEPGAGGQPALPAPDDVRPYLGRYRARPGIDTLVEWRDGALRLVAPHPGAYSLHAPASLEPVAERDGVYVIVGGRGAGEEVAFGIGPGARATDFTIGGFVYRRSG